MDDAYYHTTHMHIGNEEWAVTPYGYNDVDDEMDIDDTDTDTDTNADDDNDANIEVEAFTEESNNISTAPSPPPSPTSPPPLTWYSYLSMPRREMSGLIVCHGKLLTCVSIVVGFAGEKCRLKMEEGVESLPLVKPSDGYYRNGSCAFDVECQGKLMEWVTSIKNEHDDEDDCTRSSISTRGESTSKGRAGPEFTDQIFQSITSISGHSNSLPDRSSTPTISIRSHTEPKCEDTVHSFDIETPRWIYDFNPPVAPPAIESRTSLSSNETSEYNREMETDITMECVESDKEDCPSPQYTLPSSSLSTIGNKLHTSPRTTNYISNSWSSSTPLSTNLNVEMETENYISRFDFEKFFELDRRSAIPNAVCYSPRMLVY